MTTLGIILTLIGIILLIIADIAENRRWKVSSTGIAWIAGVLFTGGMEYLYLGKNLITPMDVYQEKTTLKYTVIDSVKVDSTVIWKPEYKK